MALDDVVDEILAQAEKEGRKIVEEGKKEAEAISNDGQERVKKARDDFRSETAKMLEETERMHVSTMNLKVNKMVLHNKKELIDGIFARLAERIKDMNDTERRNVLEKLLENAGREIDVAFIYTNGNDRKVLQRIKSAKFEGEIDAIGGMIAENSNRDVRVNYTFETFLERLKESYLHEVTKRIF